MDFGIDSNKKVYLNIYDYFFLYMLYNKRAFNDVVQQISF